MSQDFLPVLREYVLYIESMKVSAEESWHTLSPSDPEYRKCACLMIWPVPEPTNLTSVLTKTLCQQSVLRKRDQTQAEYEGRLEAAVLRRQEERTPVRQKRVYAILMRFPYLRTFTARNIP